MRICVAQVQSVVGDMAANLARMEAVVEQYAASSDVVVFPELFLTGYPTSDLDTNIPRVAALCEPRDGPAFQRVAAMARTHNVAVIYGYGELDGDKRYIAVAFVGKDGTCLASYRKIHLWDPFGVFERVLFAEGAACPPLVSFMGVQVGLLVCWDVEFPENCRALALQGAQVVISIAANSDAFVLSHIVRVRAFENLMFVVYCNATGEPFCGTSTVAAPTGSPVLVHPRGEACGVVTVEPHAAEWDRGRERNPFFKHRRPDVYGAVARASDVV